jgi:uncharacterized protein with PIN domain
VKFLCDASLARLARWLRLLGIDTTLEPATKAKDYESLFHKARQDNRVILTTSTTLVQRRTCPSCYLVTTVGGQEQLEATLVRIVRKYRVHVTRKRLLSVCGKCGGGIEGADAHDMRFNGRKLPLDRPLYLCCTCHQPYYFNDNPSSSPARAMRLAQHLLSLIEAQGRREDETADGGDAADADAGDEEEGGQYIQKQTLKDDDDDNDDDDDLRTLFERRDQGILERAVQTNLYKNKTADAEVEATSVGVDGARPSELQACVAPSDLVHTSAMVPFPAYTNKNQGFSGCLDYIFVTGMCQVLSSGIIQSITNNDRNCKTSHSHNHTSGADAKKEGSEEKEKEIDDEVFPSKDWPSDHVLVHAAIRFR